MGIIKLNKCMYSEEQACNKLNSCKFKKSRCGLLIGPKTNNLIECGKDIKSKWYLLEKNNPEKKTILCIGICWGTDFQEIEFKQIWEEGLRDSILEVISTLNYDEIILNGHSMGAGLLYMILVYLFRERHMEIIASKIKDFKNMYLNLFGLGRLPTDICVEFKGYYDNFKFNFFDIISHNSKENTFDAKIDSVKIVSESCDFYSDNRHFYCINRSGNKNKKHKDKVKILDNHSIIKNLPSDLNEANQQKYRHCTTKELWG